MRIFLTQPQVIRELWITKVCYAIIPALLMILGYGYHAIPFLVLIVILVVTGSFLTIKTSKNDICLKPEDSRAITSFAYLDIRRVKIFQFVLYLIFLMAVVSVVLEYTLYAVFSLLLVYFLYAITIFLEESLKLLNSCNDLDLKKSLAQSKTLVRRALFRRCAVFMPFEIIAIALICFKMTDYALIALASTLYAHAINTFVANSSDVKSAL